MKEQESPSADGDKLRVLQRFNAWLSVGGGGHLRLNLMHPKGLRSLWIDHHSASSLHKPRGQIRQGCICEGLYSGIINGYSPSRAGGNDSCTKIKRNRYRMHVPFAGSVVSCFGMSLSCLNFLSIAQPPMICWLF